MDKQISLTLFEDHHQHGFIYISLRLCHRVIFDAVTNNEKISQIHTYTANTVTNEMLLLPPYDKALEMVGLEALIIL